MAGASGYKSELVDTVIFSRSTRAKMRYSSYKIIIAKLMKTQICDIDLLSMPILNINILLILLIHTMHLIKRA